MFDLEIYEIVFIAFFAIQNYIKLEKPKFNYLKKIENELQIN